MTSPAQPVPFVDRWALLPLTVSRPTEGPASGDEAAGYLAARGIAVRPAPSALTLAQVTQFLTARRLVATVLDGARVAQPGSVVVHLAVTRGEAEGARVAVDEDGAVAAGPELEDVVAALAPALQADVTMGDVVYTGDGSATDAEPGAGRSLADSREVYAWRTSDYSPIFLRTLAAGLRVPLAHVEVEGWLVAWPAAPARTMALDLSVEKREHPWFIAWRRGEVRALRWKETTGRHALDLTAASQPRSAPLVSTEGTQAAALATALAEPARWRGAEPWIERAELGAEEPLTGQAAELRTAELAAPDDLLPAAARIFGLPRAVVDVIDGDPPEPAATTAPARGGVLGSAVRGGVDSVLREPLGHGLYSRFRRFLWHRPGLMALLSVAEVALGVVVALNLLGWEGWLADAGVLRWIVGAVLVLDGATDLAAALTLARRRRG